ncbi:MAG: hypothetical protein J5857_05940 [Treponema sp.]|nr:hypothetical protein [Treponema sp.]
MFSQTNEYQNIDETFIADFVKKTWTTNEGLPGVTITDLLQDNKGYIWIGTYDGLVRFDGVEFTNYNRSVDEKYDFASARSIIQDSSGNLWVGHNDEGVTKISPHGEIKKFTMETGLPNNKVNALCEDKFQNIWIGTSSGICCITPDDMIFKPNVDADLDLETITVQDFFCDSIGRVWIATGTKDNFYVYQNNKVSRYTGIEKIESPMVQLVRQDNEGSIWFCGEPHFALRLKNGQETLFDMSPDGFNPLAINSMVQDSSGNYWFGSDAGIMVMHGGSRSYYNTSNGLTENGISRLMEDREGNIWIGLNRGGIQKLSKGKFQTVKMAVSVNSICEDKARGVAWLGCDDGLYCFKDNKFIENDITASNKGIRVRHVGLTKDGELLISAYSDTAQKIVYPDGTIKSWSKKEGFASNRGRVAIKIANGDIYVGTPEGLCIIHADGQMSTLTRDDGFSNHYIMWLFEDKEGQVWTGTNGGGVFVLKDEKIIRSYSTDDGLAGNVIFKILDYDDAIWIATGTGLSKYISETNSFVNFNSKNGLGTDSVFQMICDDTGTVWMTSNNGVFSASYSEMEEVVSGERQKISVRYYGASDGLITAGVTSTSLSEMDSKGRVWFTLTDGFSIYDAQKGTMNKNAPKIEIQDFTVDNVTNDYYGDTIVLEPSAKRLSIKYTGLSFISSDSMRFRYKLEGFDEDYSEWTSARSVSYTNLKPGTYHFTLISQNSDGIQSEPSEPVIIVKKPYIWQQTWFWAAIIALIVAIITYKIISMRRYQIVLEKRVDQRTRELKIANEKAEYLLLNILPKEVAAELTEHPDRTIAKKFPNVTVLFTDIVGFTKMSGGMTAEEVVTMLNKMISLFDERAKREGIEKIKTIGDAYMAAVGLKEEADRTDAARMIRFAQGLIEDVLNYNESSDVKIQIRLGINTGELVAGVIGKSKFIYDIWGDTVNVASRMESTGQPIKIHVSEQTWQQTNSDFAYSDSVEIEVKGKGQMKTYFL